jgi:hypothetical protein
MIQELSYYYSTPNIITLKKPDSSTIVYTTASFYTSSLFYTVYNTTTNIIYAELPVGETNLFIYQTQSISTPLTYSGVFDVNLSLKNVNYDPTSSFIITSSVDNLQLSVTNYITYRLVYTGSLYTITLNTGGAATGSLKIYSGSTVYFYNDTFLGSASFSFYPTGSNYYYIISGSMR